MNKYPNEPKLLDHEADGIKELDNLLPRWWVWLFYLTTIFAILYVAYYHVLRMGDLQAAEFDKEWKRGNEIQKASIAKFEGNLDKLTPSKDQVVLAKGEQTFMNLCAPCHRKDAGGLVGPNLCDDYWIHGSNYVDSVKVIINGVPAKGMITWRGILKPNDIEAVASYIHTKRGSNPKNPKPPENQQQQPTGPSIYE
jgi:cytochrome c oxidase cbb3-type subunit 3